MTIHYPASVWGEKMGGVPRSPFEVRRDIADCGRNRPWTIEEYDTIKEAIRAGKTLAECCALFPYRSFHSVKDPYYRLGGGGFPGGRPKGTLGQKSDEWVKAEHQKTAREGSAKLLAAIMSMVSRSSDKRAN